MMEFNTDFTTNAPAGAELLRVSFPRWASHIDLDRLNINDPEQCIAGQLYGSYYDAKVLLFGDNAATAVNESHLHGFATLYLADLYEETRLEAEWEYIIRELRSA